MRQYLIHKYFQCLVILSQIPFTHKIFIFLVIVEFSFCIVLIHNFLNTKQVDIYKEDERKQKKNLSPRLNNIKLFHNINFHKQDQLIFFFKKF